MLNKALKSASPIVIPLDAFQSVNGFTARKANHFALPFVSIENAPIAVTGNMSRPLFVPKVQKRFRRNDIFCCGQWKIF